MITYVYYDENTDWEKLMHRMCVCGHELYLHAFTDHTSPSGSPVLWTSQCILCPYDYEKDEFTCTGFRQAKNE